LKGCRYHGKHYLKWGSPVNTENKSVGENNLPINDQPGQLAPVQFPQLDSITLPTVKTDAAAHYLNRKAQTLRVWACLENGPIRPLRINGRLAWPVAELRKVLGVAT
jgi:hypothetical protein